MTDPDRPQRNHEDLYPRRNNTQPCKEGTIDYTGKRAYWVLWSWPARLRPLVQRNGLARRGRAMRVLSYLRMEINPDQIDAYEEDLEEMIRLARKTPGLLGVESFRARNKPNVYLVLSEWESHEAMRFFLMQERHRESIGGYKRGYGEGCGRGRYARLHGVRHERLE